MVSVVTHFNHAREITTREQACPHLAAGRLVLLNQSVLLKGVNDTVEVLEELCRELMSARRQPITSTTATSRAAWHIGAPPLRGARRLAGALRQPLRGFAIRLCAGPAGRRRKVPIGPAMSRVDGRAGRYAGRMGGEGVCGGMVGDKAPRRFSSFPEPEPTPRILLGGGEGAHRESFVWE